MARWPDDKGGATPKEIDFEKLEALCKIQCTGEECASILDMDYDTLNSRLKTEGYGGFSEYFKKYSAGGKASLRRRQFKTALEGNVTMGIWLGKQYLLQSDKVEKKIDTTIKVTEPIAANQSPADAAKDFKDMLKGDL